MAMNAGGNAGQSYSEINMTPLIDVMLVLLIIFIITLPHQTHAIKIDNPAPRTEQPEVHIAVDDFAHYEIVAQTLADLQHRGLTRIGFVKPTRD
jgi:biopolymer transport protein ExbD